MEHYKFYKNTTINFFLKIWILLFSKIVKSYSEDIYNIIKNNISNN